MNHYKSPLERSSPLIYLVDTEILHAASLIKVLETADYKIQHFAELSTLKDAIDDVAIPLAVIVNVDSFNNIFSQFVLLEQMVKLLPENMPVITLLEQDDSEKRIAAYRMGVCRCFVKPVVDIRLVHYLDKVTCKIPEQAYKVLLLDDDPVSLKSSRKTMLHSGLDVLAEQNPLAVFDLIRKFKPEVLVLDLSISEVTGPDITMLLREDEQLDSLPVICLTTESDLSKQLLALNLGGINLLAKPVDPARLVPSIITQAKKYRLNKDNENKLKQTLYEQKCEHLALNQHAIVSIADASGNISYVNDRFIEVSGFNREELMGQNHRLVKSHEHLKKFYSELWNTISKGHIWQGELCNKRKNGELYWVKSTIMPFMDENGIPYQYISLRTDISHVKNIEKQALIATERLSCSQTFANIGTWDWNITTGELFWSERVAPLFGYPNGELETSYENFINAIYPEDKDRVIQAINDCIEKGKEYSIEHRVVWPDGQIRWVLEKGNVVRNSKNKSENMLGVVIDIQERKINEMALRESEEKYRRLFELSKDPMWMLRGNYFVMANNAAVKILGYDRVDDLLGTHPADLSPRYQPDGQLSYEKSNAMMATAYSDGYAHFEWNHKSKQGKELSFEVSLTRVPFEGEQGLFCIWHDISERVDAKVRQQGNNHILELIAKDKPVDEVLSVVISHAEEMFKESICSILLLDTSRKHLINGAVARLPDFYNETIESIEIGMGVCSCGEAAFTGNRVIAEDIMQHPNWVDYREVAQKAGVGSCWSQPIFSSQGIVLGTFAIYHTKPFSPDLSEIKQAEELARFVAITLERDLAKQALVNAKEDAEKANHSKSEFLSSMSHELRTPMNAILGFAQILELDDVLSDEQQDSLHEILKAGNHLLKLINEVLDLAKIESGQLELSFEPVALLELVDECFTLVSPIAQKQGITIRHGELHGYSVRADRTRLKQVLLNLLSNAIKYNREQGSVDLEVESINDNDIQVTVRDSGKGIVKEHLDKLFQPFNRLDAENSGIEGTGIGLTITRKLVELMAGKISVESHPGIGSRFCLILPMDSQIFPEKYYDDEAIMKDSNEVIKQHTILYIEDNPANLKLVSRILSRQENINLISAHEAKLGLELAAIHRPELILLDINMPHMNGYQVLSILQSDDILNKIPVVAVTANAMKKDIERGKAAGFSDYLTKPLDIARLIEIVEEYLADD